MKPTSQSSLRIAPSSTSRLLAAVLGLLCLAAAPLHASETIIVGQPPDAQDQATLRAMEDASRRAVVARDYATLERIWSERFVVNAPNNMIFSSRAAVFEVFRRSAADLYSTYEKNIECIAFDGDLAIVMGVEKVTPLGAPAGEKPAQRRYTNVWRFGHGAWVLIARQATMVDGDLKRKALAKLPDVTATPKKPAPSPTSQ